MSSRTNRTKLAACAIGLLTAGTLALSASPASAIGSYSGLAYVAGSGTYTDDWGNEGILSTSINTSSNATCLWQKILWADGAIESDGTTFDSADIDGVFGSNTKAATADWQSAFGGSGDGIGVAGDDTFRAAGKGLQDQDGDRAVDHFDGSRYTINITRDSNGRYNFYDGDGNARLAGYDYRTCS
ncbi:peptidoglycan-binding protein [Streptomyces sp. NPDC102270]|uniref:peptidoglycan-binding domain-containing protein n=1 Tax=Streptomyces sp. NPDC102270 TaxID=3366150 RepID=UPI00381487A8